uniref:Membrane protein n=1 Tax=Mammaliicoccus phage MSShimriz1 TaxID=3230127 RepID=A0AAU8GT67_9VIRU
MERVMDSIDKATGVTWGALVTQQVFYGLGMIILASLALLGLCVILKKVTIRNISFNISLVMLFLTVVSIALLGYGFMHVINPGYYALQDMKDSSFQFIDAVKH